MKNNIIEIILNEIAYTGNKKLFIEKFYENVRIETLLNLSESLPDSEKNKLNTLSSDPEKKPLEIAKILKSHYTKKEIEVETVKVAKKAIGELISELLPALPAEKRRKLAQILPSGDLLA